MVPSVELAVVDGRVKAMVDSLGRAGLRMFVEYEGLVVMRMNHSTEVLCRQEGALNGRELIGTTLVLVPGR